ncbi:MAG: hypothetical protein R3B09_34030 [Nannocystaceae bacterium]
MLYLIGLVGTYPELAALRGLAALTLLFALIAPFRPRRWLLITVALLLALTLVGLVAADASLRGALIAETFTREGATLVFHGSVEATAQRVARAEERELLTLLLGSLTTLLVLPLWSAAALRFWRPRGPRDRWTPALLAVALPLPLLLCAAVAMSHVLFSFRNLYTCTMGGPFDASPRWLEHWAHLDHLRAAVLTAGLVAGIVGALAAIWAARAGHIARDRGLLAALVVFALGGAASLATRDHAVDVAEGPRRAFVGAPDEPFGRIAQPWAHPDFIRPPTTAECPLWFRDERDPLVSLEITATGELVAPFDDLGEAPRGTAAWERKLQDELPSKYVYLLRERRRPPSIAAVIDEGAPFERVLPYLAIAAAFGVREVVVVARRSRIESTRTLGDVQVDKACVVGARRPGPPRPPAPRGGPPGESTPAARPSAPPRRWPWGSPRSTSPIRTGPW